MKYVDAVLFNPIFNFVNMASTLGVSTPKFCSLESVIVIGIFNLVKCAGAVMLDPIFNFVNLASVLDMSTPKFRILEFFFVSSSFAARTPMFNEDDAKAAGTARRNAERIINLLSELHAVTNLHESSRAAPKDYSRKLHQGAGQAALSALSELLSKILKC